jgi:anaerobic magnesium-protoporphyrin IX monomethyl ester cyclase
MPDILLIQPPIRDFYLTAKRTVPYGLAALAAAVRQAGFTVAILDGLASAKARPAPLPWEMAHLNTYYGKPDVSPLALFHQFRHFGRSIAHIGRQAGESGAFLVGIASLFTAYSQEALAAARSVKSYLPGCRVVLGGHHPTALPAEAMACPAVDFVIRGEGENALPQLARALRSGGDLERVPGIVLRRPDGSLHLSPPAVVAELDDCPQPARDLIDARFYRRRRRGSTVVVASRGCPMTCSYCSLGRYSEIPYRRRALASVLAEIDTAVNAHDARFIDFEDENLALDKPWLMALLEGIQRRFGRQGLELRAMNGLFPPSLDSEMIAAMRAAGFRSLNLALATTHLGQLARFRRPDVRRAFDNALSQAAANHLEAVGYIIVGAPGQRARDSLADLCYLAERRVLAGVSLFYPAPGSLDFERCRREGLLPAHHSLFRATALPLSATTTRLEAVTLLRLGRLINFLKALAADGEPLPRAARSEERLPPGTDRRELGRRLVAWFRHDGRLRGVTPQGAVYAHRVDRALAERFAGLLPALRIRPASERHQVLG